MAERGNTKHEFIFITELFHWKKPAYSEHLLKCEYKCVMGWVIRSEAGEVTRFLIWSSQQAVDDLMNYNLF